MTLRISCILATLLLALAVPAAAQESLLQKLLRIAGITAAPSQLRAPGDVAEGEVWITDVRTGTTRQVTKESGYRSPVFAPDDGRLYALKGDTLVRLADDGDMALAQLPGAVKLVGFDPDTIDDIIFLRDGDLGNSPLAIVTPGAAAAGAKAIASIPLDMGAAETRQMVTFIRGDERKYGDVRLFTRTESRQGAIRAVEWTDVFLQRGTEPPVNISGGDGTSSGQPALSPDGARVVYIKVPR
jgi:hypothetical protein